MTLDEYIKKTEKSMTPSERAMSKMYNTGFDDGFEDAQSCVGLWSPKVTYSSGSATQIISNVSYI